MNVYSIKLPPELEAEVEAEAKRRGTKKASVVREALETYMAARPVKARGSCLDLARDLSGILKGPRDLSANQRRLEGFGR